MKTPCPNASDVLAALHARFAVEKVWCQNPTRRLQRFVEAVDTARAGLPASQWAGFDCGVDVIRAQLFCDCDDARAAFARAAVTVRRAA